MPRKLKQNPINTEVKKRSKSVKVLKPAEKIALTPLAEKQHPKILSHAAIDIPVDIKIHSKSKHVVNLKNPHPQSFTPFSSPVIPSLGRNAEPKTIVYRSPKAMPKRTHRVSVDFIGARKIFDQLSIVELLHTVWHGFIGLFILLQAAPAAQSQQKRIVMAPAITVDPTPLPESEIEDIFAAPESTKFFNFSVPRDWPRRIFVFVVIAVLFVLPLQGYTYFIGLQDTKDKVLLATNEAIENLKLGEKSIANFDLASASSQFGQAKTNFVSAQDEINNLNILSGDVIKLIPGQGQSLQAGTSLLGAGELIADSAQLLTNSGLHMVDGSDVKGYFERLSSFQVDLRHAIDEFHLASDKIQSINPSDLPPEHQATFNRVVDYLPTIDSGLTNLYSLNDSILKILGGDQWQRYLIIFENNNELRATGGFMGSFAVLDIDRGQIKKLDIPGGGTYDLQGSLVPKVAAPEPLQLLKTRWEFQDSNWWPDFPTSAKKIEWFYLNSNNASSDGVIVLTSTVMERLLDIFGPIDMPDYGRTITSQNFVEETQKIVELEYDKTVNRPKQFLADLAPKLLDKIFNAKNDQLKKLIPILIQSLNERQILVYFNQPPIENMVDAFGWSGALRSTGGDFLSIVHTNLAGGKTDGVIKQSIQHIATVQNNGSIIDTVTVTRRHTGVAGSDPFTGVQNNSYVRFYVPEGSTLINATGFKKPAESLFKTADASLQTDTDLATIEGHHSYDDKTGTDIYTENGKTVFGNWLQLKPGEVAQATISYRLPFTLALEGQNTFYYSLLAQKQAGTVSSDFQSNLILPDSFKPAAKFPSTLAADQHQVSFSAPLTVDQFYGVVLISQ